MPNHLQELHPIHHGSISRLTFRYIVVILGIKGNDKVTFRYIGGILGLREMIFVSGLKV